MRDNPIPGISLLICLSSKDSCAGGSGMQSLTIRSSMRVDVVFTALKQRPVVQSQRFNTLMPIQALSVSQSALDPSLFRRAANPMCDAFTILD